MIKKVVVYNSFLSLIVNCCFCQNNQGPEKWEVEVRAYEREDSINAPALNGILFTGSSSIRLWEDLPQRFPGKKILNRGIGGSEVSDLAFYCERLIYPYKPKKIFIYSGTNDIWGGKSPEKVLLDFKDLYGKIKQRLPNTKVYYISIQNTPARDEKSEAFKRANELIKAFLLNTQDTFIDVSHLLLDQHGEPKSDFFLEDQVHMNVKGYDRWTRVLKYFVDQ